MSLSVESQLGLYCLPKSTKQNLISIWVKVVRYVTFSNCQNWRSIKIFIYSYNKICQPPGSRIEKRQYDANDVISASKKTTQKTTFLIVFPG